MLAVGGLSSTGPGATEQAREQLEMLGLHERHLALAAAAGRMAAIQTIAKIQEATGPGAKRPGQIRASRDG